MNDRQRALDCAKAMYASDLASRHLGIEIDIPAAGRCEARMEVTETMINGVDLCHGGYIFLLADTAFAFACNAYDDLTVAAIGEIDFVRPGKLGDSLLATVEEQHKGASRGLYDVRVSNQHDKTVALFRGRSHSTGKPLLTQK
jgi:acyl-CoA thioesterase